MAAIDTLIGLHKKRWEDSSFHDRSFERFFREVSAMALEKDWLRFYQLRVADEVIANLHSFRYGDVVYAYQIGFDYDWARYSPGRLLAGHAIREAIKEGAREFDWLQGSSKYKLEWTDDVRKDTHTLLSNNRRGDLYLLGVKYVDRMNSSGGEALPKALLPVIERFAVALRR
jgi:CelD/BcsL family acetyltransferase involved in cellulose biosynthesis